MDNGYSCSDIINSLMYILKSNLFTDISEDLKINFFNKISNTCYIINKGIDTNIQLSGCIADMCLSVPLPVGS